MVPREREVRSQKSEVRSQKKYGERGKLREGWGGVNCGIGGGVLRIGGDSGGRKLMGLSGGHWYGFVVVGLVIGVVGGMLGIGGGVLVIPALVFLFGFSQKMAVGTSLAMLLPPIGIFAILGYWPDSVNVRAAALLAGGFAVGGWVGGRLVQSGYVPE